jgi:hypothetical protein
VFKAEQVVDSRAAEVGADRVTSAAKPNYQMFYDPNDWGYSAALDELVPMITHQAKTVGSGAVLPNGDFGPERLRLERAGRIPIPHDAIPGESNYVVAYTNKHGKRVHTSIFEAPVAGPGGETKYTFNMPAYHAFLRILKRRGVILPPKPLIIVGLRAQARDALRWHDSRAPGEVASPERREAHARRRAAIRKSIDCCDRELAASEAHWGKLASAPEFARLKRLEAMAAEMDATEGEIAKEAAVITRAPIGPVETEARDEDGGEDLDLE